MESKAGKSKIARRPALLFICSKGGGGALAKDRIDVYVSSRLKENHSSFVRKRTPQVLHPNNKQRPSKLSKYFPSLACVRVCVCV